MRESALETWLLIKGSRALARIPRLGSPCLWFKYEGCVSDSGDIFKNVGRRWKDVRGPVSFSALGCGV